MVNKKRSKPPIKTPLTPLSQQRVLQAALNLADSVGLDELSMRKLAQTLGVQAMSLYNHVKNKEDMINGLVDMVFGEMDVPDMGKHWKAAMRDRAISAHKVLLRHPWAAMAILTSKNAGPANLRYFNATLGCLHAAGFSYAMADRIRHAIDNHIYGFTLQELNFPFKPEEYAEAAKQFLPTIPADDYPHFSALATRIAEKRYNGLHEFTFGLDLLLDGMERLCSKTE